LAFFFDRERRVIERAQADSNRALTYGAEGRYEQALALFDEVIGEHREATQPLLRAVIASAYFNKGVTLANMDRPGLALAVWSEQVQRFGRDREVACAHWVCSALFNLACELARSERDPHKVIAAYEELVARCDAYPGDERLFEIGCDALSNLALFCEGAAESARVVATCDRLLARLGPAPRAAHRPHLLNALGAKGAALGELGEHERAIATMDAALGALSQHDAPERSERAVCLLNNKGRLLLKVDRYDEAARVFNASYEASRGRSEPDTVVYGAGALMNKAIAEHLSGAHDAALATYGQVIDRFAGKPDPRLSEIAAKSFVFTASLLREAGRHDEVAAVEARCNALGEQLKDADDQQLAARALLEHARRSTALGDRAELLDAVVETLQKHPGSGRDEAVSAHALATKAVDLARAGRLGEAIAVWDDVLARLSPRVDEEAIALVARTMLNRAGALATLSCADEALAALDEIVRRFARERVANDVVIAAKQTATNVQRWSMERSALQPQAATLPETRALLDGLDEQLRKAPPLGVIPQFVKAQVARETLAATLAYAAHDRSRHAHGENGWSLVASFVKKVELTERRRPSALVVEARPTLGHPAALDSNYHLMTEAMAVFGMPMHLAARHTHIGKCCEWMAYPLKDAFVAAGVACCCHFEAREAQS